MIILVLDSRHCKNGAMTLSKSDSQHKDIQHNNALPLFWVSLYLVLFTIMLNVITPSVVILSVIMLCVIVPNNAYYTCLMGGLLPMFMVDSLA